MLERLGFRYVHRIDPFDGGPHYEAPLAAITLVKAYRTAALGEGPLRGEAPERLVARTLPRGPSRFRAVRTPARLDGRPARAAGRGDAAARRPARRDAPPHPLRLIAPPPREPP